MNGNNCLLDTSVIIHVFRKTNGVSGMLDGMEEIYVPVTVIGELCYGAYRSADVSKHITQTNLFLSNCTILYPDEKTADCYGSIKAALTRKGKPIPDNDIWIAAMALQHDLALFTTDKHFEEIDNIKLI